MTAFVQDEIALFGNRLAVTLGSQVQHDSDSGAGVQPTARVMWKARPRQRLWAATSRALRTPSLYERGIRVDYPPVPSRQRVAAGRHRAGQPGGGDRNVSSTRKPDTGSRSGRPRRLTSRDSSAATTTCGRRKPAAPIVQFVPSPHILVTSQFGNQLEATTRGLEVAGHWTPVPAWRLDGSYTAFHVTPHLAAASQDPAAATEDGSAPRTQWQVRSAFSPVTRATLNVAIFHVGPLEQLQVDAYTRADVSAEWRFTSRLSAMAIGQNLFDAAHAEFAGAGSLLLATQVPRSASLRLRWTFR